MDFITIYLYINFFIIGTLFGSFFSLANYRLPRKLDIVATRSFCPKCNHKLGFFDLIPVLSYIFHFGKCKYCKEKISIRYLLLEVCSGLAFACFYYLFGISVYTFIAIALYIYLVMTTGCYINKQKLIKEELNKLDMDMQLKKNSGVFITEIIIAAVVFAISVSATYLTFRNSSSSKYEDVYKSNSMLECTKIAEIALGLNYDDVNSFVSSTVLDGVVYSTTVTVTKQSDMYNKKADNIKIINAKTTCLVNNQKYSYEITTSKKRKS